MQGEAQQRSDLKGYFVIVIDSIDSRPDLDRLRPRLCVSERGPDPHPSDRSACLKANAPPPLSGCSRFRQQIRNFRPPTETVRESSFPSPGPPSPPLPPLRRFSGSSPSFWPPPSSPVSSSGPRPFRARGPAVLEPRLSVRGRPGGAPLGARHAELPRPGGASEGGPKPGRKGRGGRGGRKGRVVAGVRGRASEYVFVLQAVQGSADANSAVLEPGGRQRGAPTRRGQGRGAGVRAVDEASAAAVVRRAGDAWGSGGRGGPLRPGGIRPRPPIRRGRLNEGEGRTGGWASGKWNYVMPPSSIHWSYMDRGADRPRARASTPRSLLPPPAHPFLPPPAMFAMSSWS